MTAPHVIGAISSAPNKVQVQFDQAMLVDATLEAAGSYFVAGFVTTAAVSVGPAYVEVTLDHELISGQQYAIVVLGPVVNLFAEVLSASFKDAAFVGVGDPPQVVSVSMLDPATVEVTFNQAVQASASCFSFLGPSIVTVLDVQTAGAVVTIEVSPDLLDGAPYKLVSRDVEDSVGNLSIKTVTEFAALGDLPQLVSAVFDAGVGELLLTFDKEMNIGLVLVSPDTYSILPIDATAGPIHVRSVSVLDSKRIVLSITEGKIGAQYSITVSEDATDFAGNGIDPAANDATFVSTAPSFKVTYAKAVSPQAVLVVFNRPPDESAATIDKSHYSIPGLAVVSAELMSGAVLLKTAKQIEGQEYQLTTSGVLDEANNPFDVAQVRPFTGWRPTVNSGIRMYDFMYQSIRAADERQGTGLLARLYSGWQEVWSSLIEMRESLTRQISPLTVSAEYLPIELWSAGWSDGHEEFVASLDERTARRLLAESPNLWRERGSETAYVNGVSLLEPVRMVVRNWFWARWVEGDDWFGEDRRGWDVHVLDLPGYGSDEYYSQIRIVDAEGKLKRPQIEHMLETLRPVKEIVQIAYIQFYCRFRDEGDEQLFVSDDFVDIESLISGGEIEMSNPGTIRAVCRELGDSVLYFRVEGEGDPWGLVFRWQDNDNCYRLLFDVAGQEIRLVVLVAGVPTTLVAVPALDLDVPLVDNFPYGVRIQMLMVGGVDQQIRVFLDGAELLNVIDNSFMLGAFGLRVPADAKLACTEIEGFALPLDTATLSGQ